ncbi:MAG: hypothetical protein M3O31_02810 [Acidobacteriota bacterium]|nr:hypothetical protein [Acidobacteriota bacterium]
MSTYWLCLDCELMPWSAKAQDLLWNPSVDRVFALTFTFSCALGR